MKTIPWRSAIFVMAASLLTMDCVVPPAKSMPRRAAFPVANEKVFLSAAVDSSMLSQFPGWPSEEALQTLLKSALPRLDSNMAVEFRRCEKFGLYELVEDSLKASVCVVFVIGPHQFKKDTLTMPVNMSVRKPVLNKSLTRTIIGRGVYRAKSQPKSPVHYLNVLIADFCRNFPYGKATEALYRPTDEPRPGMAKKAVP